jgi:hypothetical protein
MGFVPPRKPSSLPTPPPPPRSVEWDRFGLTTHRPSLLSETVEERHERIATIEQLAADLFKSAVTHLGEMEARSLFKEITKDYSKKGKQPRRDENNLLLSKFYEFAHEHPKKSRNAIATKVAEWASAGDTKALRPKTSRWLASLVRRINKLVRERERQQKAMEAMYRSSLLEDF